MAKATRVTIVAEFDRHEFKFEIGNSTTGKIGAVFYVKNCKDENDARAKLKTFVGNYGEPIRETDGDVECLVYFGEDNRVAATKATICD